MVRVLCSHTASSHDVTDTSVWALAHSSPPVLPNSHVCTLLALCEPVSCCRLQQGTKDYTQGSRPLAASAHPYLCTWLKPQPGAQQAQHSPVLPSHPPPASPQFMCKAGCPAPCTTHCLETEP